MAASSEAPPAVTPPSSDDEGDTASSVGGAASVDSAASGAIFFQKKDDLMRPVKLTPSLFDGRPATIIFDYPEYCGEQRRDAGESNGRAGSISARPLPCLALRPAQRWLRHSA